MFIFNCINSIEIKLNARAPKFPWFQKKKKQKKNAQARNSSVLFF